jgi:hypothetical protein
VSRDSWARSGRRAPAARSSGARPVGSWALSLTRAAEAFASVGGTARCHGCGVVGRIVDGRVLARHEGDAHDDDRPMLSDTAAAAVLSVALALWADTAASLAADDGDATD